MRSVNGDNGEWKVKQSYFQGYVKSQLESLTDEMKDMRSSYNTKCLLIDQRLVNLEKETFLTKGKMIGLGVAGGVVVALVQTIAKLFFL
jgi:hypothetical protein